MTAGLRTAAELYRRMRLIRGFEELALRLVKSGDIVGGIHPYIGEEAVAVGRVRRARATDDLITSTHRGHGHVLAKGADPGRMLAELAGRDDRAQPRAAAARCTPRTSAVGILGANAIVGAAAPIAAGAAWAAQRSGSGQVVATFFGDGGAEPGRAARGAEPGRAVAAAGAVRLREQRLRHHHAGPAPAWPGPPPGRAAAFGIPARDRGRHGRRGGARRGSAGRRRPRARRRRARP